MKITIDIDGVAVVLSPVGHCVNITCGEFVIFVGQTRGRNTGHAAKLFNDMLLAVPFHKRRGFCDAIRGAVRLICMLHSINDCTHEECPDYPALSESIDSAKL